ncbi:MAG TPA: efflux RND transporter periplasmic adaptor subunit [Pirellulaceae bacterium]|nr:efflux RND transporter periplasmic adaptor subunit [Pirellulaceae bacterium]
MAGLAFRFSILATLVTLAGCGSSNRYAEPPPPGIHWARPVRHELVEYLEFTGMTQAQETVEIRARVRGFLDERLFVEGASVTTDQLLLVIDEEPFQLALAAARARRDECAAALEQVKVSKAREVAAAQVELAEARLRLARQEEERVLGLGQRGAITAAEIDQTIAMRESRDAELATAKATLDQTTATYETGIRTAQAQLDAATIAVSDAERELSYCRMSSPIDGRIGRAAFDVGNLVGDNDSSVLATVVKSSPIVAYATLSEAQLRRVPQLLELDRARAAGEELTIELGLPESDGFPLVGRVDYLDPAVDPGTGTIRLRGVFEVDGRNILPGMFVRLRIPIARRSDALWVPERAIGTDQSGDFVLIVDDQDLAQIRPVEVGPAERGFRAVRGELNETDRVIVSGLLLARPGNPVSPTEATDLSDPFGGTAAAPNAETPPGIVADDR